MKLVIVSLFVFPAVAQISSVPCISSAAAPAASAANQGQVRRPGPPRTPAPQSAADIAEIAKLSELPPWGQNLADGDYSHGPAYPTAPELAKRVGVPEGKVIEFRMNSAESKFYPGANGPFQRRVCVYVPAGYVAGTELPVIVSADAYGMRYNLPTILDNMIYDQRLPAMAAVMIDNGGPGRSLEYDTVSSKYVEFVENDVLPRAEKEANVRFSKNPDARMTMGGSSGGAALCSKDEPHDDRYKHTHQNHPVFHLESPFPLNDSHPNVNENTSTPASRNSISNIASPIGSFCRRSWYIRGSLTWPVPSGAESQP